MRVWQDDYWQNVGAKNRLRRRGPQRARLTRTAWVIETESAAITTKLVKEVKQLTDQNIALAEQNGRLRRALEGVVGQARRIVGCLLQPNTDDISTLEPSWLAAPDWGRVLSKVRALASAAVLRSSESKKSPTSVRQRPSSDRTR
jgi:hypothetical protein